MDTTSSNVNVTLSRGILLLSILTACTLCVNLKEHLRKTNSTLTRIPLRIGVILPIDDARPFSIQKCLPAIYEALKSPRIKKLLPGCMVELYSRNSKCNAIAAPLAAFELMDERHVHVIFGPVCDYSLAPVARYSPYWNVPIITPGGMAVDFGMARMSNSSEFKLLTRVGINFDDLAVVMQNIVTTFRWNHIKILYSSDGHSEVSTKFCYLAVSAIAQHFKNVKIETDEHTFEQDEEADDLAKLLLRRIGNEYSTIILCNSPRSVRKLMIVAHQLNFDNGEYVFINLDPFSSKHMLGKPWYSADDPPELNEMARKSFETLLTVALSQPPEAELENYSNLVKTRAKNIFEEDVFAPGEDINIFVSLFHDAVLLYAHALNETLENGTSPKNGTDITKKMWNRTIHGLTGEVRINEQGDRSMDFSLLDMNPETGLFEEVGVYYGIKAQFFVREDRKIHWGGIRPYDIPNGTLTCGFDYSLCPSPKTLPPIWIFMLGASLACCVVILVTCFFYKNVKYFSSVVNSVLLRKGNRDNHQKKSKRNSDWRVKWEDIFFEALDRRKFDRKNSTLKCSLSSLLSYDSAYAAHHDDLFTKIGSFKGNRVSIRRITKQVSLTKQLTYQMRNMKNLQDDHIVRFLGMCIDQPNICVISQFCHTRTLKDLLSNSQVNLDMMFKHSLIQDIVMGMAVLHNSEVRCHGNLNTYNCIVDSRFVLKIANFGLNCLFYEAIDYENPFTDAFQDQLWTAPELLRNSHQPTRGTQKGDMYSFSIICQEILYRKGPFWIENSQLTVPEIIKLVKKGDIPYTRPTLKDAQSQDGFNSELIQLIARCWSELPSKRPDFNNLKWQLKRCISSGSKLYGTSLLDNILFRLEQYAQNLEILVEEKTKDYLDQKRRAEEILYMLLPRTVAEQLMTGGKVKAEKFECVTICFCDICGFTALSAASSPMEIVTMLNDLYTKFDAVIDTFNVYKVETIGDAYMVVSGLTRYVKNEHAAEISRMALSLSDVIKSFQIAHKPQEKLKLRTGIHSGAVCAGVVGRKMPRYCLFGDTVNTTISIQALAEPLTIHVSNKTKQILDDFNEFELIERGLVFLPGKGDVTTWWLAGLKEETKWTIDDLS